MMAMQRADLCEKSTLQPYGLGVDGGNVKKHECCGKGSLGLGEYI